MNIHERPATRHHNDSEEVKVLNQVEGQPSDDTGEVAPDLNDTETAPDHAETLAQIEQIQSLLERQKQQVSKERGAFGRLVSLFKEKIMRTDSEEKKLSSKISALEQWRNKLLADPSDTGSAREFLKLNHSNELLATSDHDRRSDRLATTLLERAATAGNVLDEGEANRAAELIAKEEDEIAARFFDEGDELNKQAELEQTLQERTTSAYKEKLASIQPSVEAKIAALQQAAEDDREINSELAELSRSKDGRLIHRDRVVETWFNLGTAMNLDSEIEQAKKPLTKLYQEQLHKGAKSMRAQMKAFEGLLSGRFSISKFSGIIEQVRRELGPGLVIDKSMRDSADADLAGMRIKDRLERMQKTLPTEIKSLLQHKDTVELYSLGGGDIGAIDGQTVVTIPSELLAKCAIDAGEVDRLLPSSLEDLQNYARQPDKDVLAELAAANQQDLSGYQDKEVA